MFGSCYALWFLVSSSLCLVLFICCGSKCSLVCVWSLLCVLVCGVPLFSNHLAEEERASCFTLIDFLLPCAISSGNVFSRLIGLVCGQ